MIASRESWRYAWLAAALAAGLVVGFARAGDPVPAMPAIELPPDVERIDDGLRGEAKLRYEPEPRGILEDTPVTQPRHDRGY